MAPPDAALGSGGLLHRRPLRDHPPRAGIARSGVGDAGLCRLLRRRRLASPARLRQWRGAAAGAPEAGPRLHHLRRCPARRRRRRQRIGARARRAWGRFKRAAVSSFAFVEASGPLYLWKLFRDSAHGRSPPGRRPAAPRLDACAHGGAAHRDGGDDPAGDVADRALRPAGAAGRPWRAARQQRPCQRAAMRRLRRFSRRRQRPPAGRAAERRRRSAPGSRRRGSTSRPIRTSSPGCTTRSATRSRCSTARRLPPSHAADLARLEPLLPRPERSPGPSARCACQAPPARAMSPARGRDWAEVRPEWGLAGCKAFIAAPAPAHGGRLTGGARLPAQL